MSKVPTFVWIILTIVIGGGFLLLLSSSKNNNSAITARELPVVVDVYSDYNCPHCANFSPFVDEVETTYGDKVDVRERHLPFLSETSYTYAYAAEAAREQDKFEEFDQNLFRWMFFKNNGEEAGDFTDEEKALYSQEVDVVKLAETLDLDIEKFNTDRESQMIKDRVLNEKTEIVKKLGSQGTPTVLIYGELFNMTAYDDLKNKVSELISEAEASKE